MMFDSVVKCLFKQQKRTNKHTAAHKLKTN